MRLMSILHSGEPGVARLDRAGGLFLLPGVSEIGPDTPHDRLMEAARRATLQLPRERVEVRPVVPRPRRIVCLGLNYRSHAQEAGRALPDYPVLFTKWASSLNADGRAIAVPPESTQVDFEAELAVVIGRPGRRIPAARAYEHLAGLTIANDVTMRDFQYKTHQWLPGKAWDGCTPVGPALVTLDEVADPQRLDLALELNGTVQQSSNTSRMIFDIPTIVATISRFTLLECGDLILTGTPAGVGYRRDPQVFLRPGDRVCVTIESVGTLTNQIVAEEDREAGARPSRAAG